MQKASLLIIILLLLGGISPVLAQADPVNPFELKQRVKKEAAKDTAQKVSTNPFDVDRDGVIPRDEHAIDFNNSLLKQSWSVGNSIFWVFILLFFFLAGLMPFARNTITSYYKGLRGAGPFSILFRNANSFFSPTGIALHLFYFLNTGLFLYLIGQQYGFLKEGLTMILLLSLSVGIFTIAKQLIIRSLGSIFPLKKDTSKFSFLLGVFSSLIGLFLFPVNLLLAYGMEELRMPIIYITVGIIVTLYLYRYVIGTFSASPQVIRNKFNFFMYLCTLEIAPVAVLIKYITAYQGVDIMH